MENSNNEPVKKDWFTRNWKWFVPTGCLSIIIITGAFISALFFGVNSLIKNSDAYATAIHIAQKNTLVIEKLGIPIESDGIASGSINTTSYKGNCNLEIPIKGPKGTAVLFVVGEKKVKWKYSEMSVYINATDEEIDLLKNKSF